MTAQRFPYSSETKSLKVENMGWDEGFCLEEKIYSLKVNFNQLKVQSTQFDGGQGVKQT